MILSKGIAMSKSYHARLHGNRIEWIDPPPVTEDDTPIEISIQLLERAENSNPARRDSPDAVSTPEAHEPDFSLSKDPAKSREIYQILKTLAALPSSFPEDAVAWQREIRRDRPLPGREE